MVGRSGKKSGKVEFHLRVSDVFQLLVNGYTTREIMQNTALREKWKVEDRQVATYLREARKLLEIESGRVRELETGKAIARYEKLYRKMESVGDYRGCLSAQKEINDLFGLYERKKIDVTTNGEKINTPQITAIHATCGGNSIEFTQDDLRTK